MLDNNESIRDRQKFWRESHLQWWRVEIVVRLLDAVQWGEMTEDEARDYISELVKKYGPQFEFKAFDSNLALRRGR
jgi:hypothetical protein